MGWFVIFFVGLGFFFIFHYHYLFLLLGLEFMLVSLFYGLIYKMSLVAFSEILIFLVLLVCMGGFGLALLVFMSRSLGVELFLFF